MSSDEHYNEHGVIPPALDDFKPDDMPAARNIGVVIMVMLIVSLVIMAVVYAGN